MIFFPGEIGGFMGLLMGASVLSIMEIFDLLLYNSIRKCCKVRVHPASSPEEVVSPTPAPEMISERDETFVTELDEDTGDVESIKMEDGEDWML